MLDADTSAARMLGIMTSKDFTRRYSRQGFLPLVVKQNLPIMASGAYSWPAERGQRNERESEMSETTAIERKLQSAKLHLVMGMGETARTEIADRELASTRERPASRDEEKKQDWGSWPWPDPRPQSPNGARSCNRRSTYPPSSMG